MPSRINSTSLNHERILLSLLFCGLWVTTGSAQSVTTISESANRFLSTLSAEELQKTTYAFTDSLRFKWTNLPVGLVPRSGIAYGAFVGFQNDGNHIHAILREKGQDFGDDMLKQHYLEAKH